MEGDIYLQPHNLIRPFLLPNLYTTVCNELKIHERINRNNKKLKKLDKNEWNSTTCIIQLKSAFVDILASESGLHWHFELHNNYRVRNELQNMKESTETTRNSRSLTN